MTPLSGRCLSLALVASLLAAGPAARAQEPGPGSAFESRYFDSDGLRLHYIDEGVGDPVVLMHGFSLDLELTWIAPGIVAALVDAGHRVIAYDFRGHGRSARPHDEALYGPPEVDDPVRLLDHLGIDRAHVLGYSRGALIANRLCAAHPERLRSVVLGGYGEGPGGDEAFDPARRAELAVSMAEGDFRPLVRAVAPDLPPEELERWNGLLAARNDGRALAAAFRADGTFPGLTAEDFRANEVPTLAIVGEDDPFRAGVERMAEAMSGLEVVVLPGADHGTTLERPAFVTAALGFFAKHR